MKLFKVALLNLLAASTVACTNMGLNSNYSCGVHDGMGCKSISEVNQILESGYSKGDSYVTGQEAGDSKQKAVYELISMMYSADDDVNMPERTPEMRLKIWFAPYIDDHDNFIEESVVYTVVKPAKWVSESVYE